MTFLRPNPEGHAACACAAAKQRRAVRSGAAWILPGAVLVLMPKCPMCLAAMISLLFGIGLSAEAATVVHGTVITFCSVAIGIFLVRMIAGWQRQQTCRTAKAAD